jgi:hypothetical protein
MSKETNIILLLRAISRLLRSNKIKEKVGRNLVMFIAIAIIKVNRGIKLLTPISKLLK